MSELAQRRCKPCAGGSAPLDNARITTLLTQAPGWSQAPAIHAIVRRFGFRNFNQTMAFINALAWIAHQQDHHPELAAGYDYCRVTFTTHAIGGLSENDFICAARINELLEH